MQVTNAENKKLIYSEGYEAFLLAYINDLYEMDAPMIAGAVERCLAKFRKLTAVDAVPREAFNSAKADCDSWKEAFAESNEKVVAECQRREAAERENRRMRAIIIQHLPGDTVCRCCKYFEQCKREAVETEDTDKEQTRFYACDGYSHFSPKKDSQEGAIIHAV